MDKAIIFLNKTIAEGKTVVVACSGGADSMCLLDIVCKLKDNKNWKIIVAHVNHNLRKESILDYELVKNYALEHNLILELKELDFQDLKFSEQMGHQKRYEFFKSLIDKYQAQYLLTAHHGDDLIETILMRINRGSTLSGYLGFKKIKKEENFDIMRPLIDYSKKEILEYNKANNIKYNVDESNNSDKFTRNRYRKNILPFLKKEDPFVHLKYQKFSNELLEYDNFIEQYITEHKFINNNIIDLKKLKKEKDFIKRKVIEKLIKNIQINDWLEVTDKNMLDILYIINKPSNKKINLNNGYIVLKEYDKLQIIKERIQKNFEYILDNDIITNDWKITFSDSQKEKNILRINKKDIVLPLIVRNRRNGDKIEIKNLGTKKVNDIFIDEKIDLSKRDSIPIIVDSNKNVLWIAGIKKSKFAKKKDEKYDIIINYEERENNDEC